MIMLLIKLTFWLIQDIQEASVQTVLTTHEHANRHLVQNEDEMDNGSG